MSDNYIRLIPTLPSWKPDVEAAEAATKYVVDLFAGPSNSADEVVHEYYDEVAFVDSGVNTESAKCALVVPPWTWRGCSGS